MLTNRRNQDILGCQREVRIQHRTVSCRNRTCLLLGKGLIINQCLP